MRRSFHFVTFLCLTTVLGVGCNDPAGPKETTPDAGSPPEPVCPVTTGPTVHEGGDVKGDEVWTAAGSPHVVEGDVRVRDGAKLTIEPCAVVQVAAGVNIEVAFPLTPNSGTFLAEGTEQRPIRFEGLEGARWGHLHVHHPGTARLAWATFSNGGHESESYSTILVSGDAEYPYKRPISVDHVTIEKSFGAGIRLWRGAGFAAGSTQLVIKDSGSEPFPFPVVIGEAGIDGLPDGSYTGNLKDEVHVSPEVVSASGGLLEDSTMRDRGVPYRMGLTRHDGFHIGGGPPAKVVTLTIEPGVKLKFAPEVALVINHYTGDNDPNGQIKAIGTADEPIVFTSASDAPKPGDWRGLWFGGAPNGGNALEHVRLEYTGADCACSLVSCNSDVSEYEAAIIFDEQPPSAFVKNAVFAHGSGHGIVQGFDGVSYDWTSNNAFEDMAGCKYTLPRNPDSSCPDPAPPCVK